MIGATARQSTLFYTPLARQASLLKDDLLDPVDELLADPELVRLVRERLRTRCPNSARTGRLGIAPDRLLRCCVLKHIKGWSFRNLERELRSNIVYRRFTHFDEDPTPNFSTFSRCFALLGTDVTRAIHQRVVLQAREQGVTAGRRLRTDTTVVETNVHYPTDSTLLSDGVRVLTRSLKRIAEQCVQGTVSIVDHARAVQRRVIEIHRAARSFKESGKERLQESYRKLIALTRRVLRTATEAVGKAHRVVGSSAVVLLAQLSLEHYLPLVKRVVAQTQARVFRGDVHVAEKVCSLFEPHTQILRKGKAHKPTEFGRLVRIDEVEHGIVSQYHVVAGNAADVNSWIPALESHQELFGKPPRLATADRGFYSARNEREARERGVLRVALPARGPLSVARVKQQKERWFRRALRWRGAIEPRIAALKHPFSMVRARYKGEKGFERYVGWCVIGHNLVSTARALARRRTNHG